MVAGWPLEAYQLVRRADIVANLEPRNGAHNANLLRREPAAALEASSSGQQKAPLHGRTPLRQPQLRTPAPGAARHLLEISFGLKAVPLIN